MCMCENVEYIVLKFVDIIVLDVIVLVVRNVMYDMLLMCLISRFRLSLRLNR